MKNAVKTIIKVARKPYWKIKFSFTLFSEGKSSGREGEGFYMVKKDFVHQLHVSLSISIPEDQVLISKVEFEELQKERLSGVDWSMKDLEQRINKKQAWIKENILYPTRFRNILDIKNGGFGFYPEVQGQTWSFLAKEMASFLDDKFAEIFLRR